MKVCRILCLLLIRSELKCYEAMNEVMNVVIYFALHVVISESKFKPQATIFVLYVATYTYMCTICYSLHK